MTRSAYPVGQTAADYQWSLRTRAIGTCDRCKRQTGRCKLYTEQLRRSCGMGDNHDRKYDRRYEVIAAEVDLAEGSSKQHTFVIER